MNTPTCGRQPSKPACDKHSQGRLQQHTHTPNTALNIATPGPGRLTRSTSFLLLGGCTSAGGSARGRRPPPPLRRAHSPRRYCPDSLSTWPSSFSRARCSAGLMRRATNLPATFSACNAKQPHHTRLSCLQTQPVEHRRTSLAPWQRLMGNQVLHTSSTLNTCILPERGRGAAHAAQPMQPPAHLVEPVRQAAGAADAAAGTLSAQLINNCLQPLVVARIAHIAGSLRLHLTAVSNRKGWRNAHARGAQDSRRHSP